MRIIAGRAKGTKLFTPAGQSTRPTPDRVKESLFNIIADRIPGCRFLDLFAGSAAMGLEALSREACRAVFVESRRQSVDVIRRNIEKVNFVGSSQVLPMEADKALRFLSDDGQEFDIIYIDPPYGSDLAGKAIDLIVERDILAENGLLIYERGVSDVELKNSALTIFRQKKYGDTILDFMRRE